MLLNGYSIVKNVERRQTFYSVTKYELNKNGVEVKMVHFVGKTLASAKKYASAN